jgi:hypothetical protein
MILKKITILVLGMVSAAMAQAAGKPNIIFLMADDLGYGDVGFNGNTLVQTPHLDKMAAQGIRFTRFYSVGPVCSPTRACVQTGRHCMRFGMINASIMASTMARLVVLRDASDIYTMAACVCLPLPGGLA